MAVVSAQDESSESGKEPAGNPSLTNTESLEEKYLEIRCALEGRNLSAVKETLNPLSSHELQALTSIGFMNETSLLLYTLENLNSYSYVMTDRNIANKEARDVFEFWDQAHWIIKNASLGIPPNKLRFH